MDENKISRNGRMRLLFFLPDKDEKGIRLLRQAGRLALHLDLEAVWEESELLARLREPAEDASIVLLYAPGRALLREVGRIRRLFGNAHLLLVLPGRDEDLANLAYKLRPSFVTDVDSDMLGLVSAIEKILSRSGRAAYSQRESA